MNQEHDGTIRHRIGPAGSFALNNVSGSVRLRGTDSDEVTVTVTSSKNGGMPPLVVRRSEGGLFVEPERKGVSLFGGSLGFGPGSVDFECQVPAGARVEVSTVSADIDSDGLLGEQHYKCVSGDLDVSSSGGRLAFSTVSGDASIEAREAVEIEGNSTSGDVRIRGHVIGLLRVRTVSGDVTVLGGPQVGPQHAVETVSGDLIIESSTGLTVDVRRALNFASGRGNQVIGDGSARLTFRSMSGDVDVSSAADNDSPSRRSNPVRVPVPPVAPEPPAPPPGGASHVPDEQADEPTTSFPATPMATEARSLEILRALERGEIDVDEASRLLEVADRG